MQPANLFLLSATIYVTLPKFSNAISIPLLQPTISVSNRNAAGVMSLKLLLVPAFYYGFYFSVISFRKNNSENTCISQYLFVF
jgi:hypothetical protein